MDLKQFGCHVDTEVEGVYHEMALGYSNLVSSWKSTLNDLR